MSFQSREGTTQGDLLATAMYGVLILPLVQLVSNDQVKQKWYADDGNAVGSLANLYQLMRMLLEHNLSFGYNLTSCHLIVKPEIIDSAVETFHDMEVEIVEGSRVLGSVIGS